MKKIIAWCLLVLPFGVLHAQQQKQRGELAIIARSWGLLKYYHPTVASGKLNWDSVLVAALEQRQPARRAIERMLSIAGPDTAQLYQAKDHAVFCTRNYDLSWIGRSKLLTYRQKAALLFITTHPYQGTGYYAQPDKGDDNTAYTPNEKPYTAMKLPDSSYRLLGLFRFWNFIEYFYPYKYMIGKSWGAVLDQMIPMMSKANDTVSYDKAIARLAASINDSHGGLWPQVYTTIVGKYSPPLNFRVIGNKAVVTLLADSSLAGIRRGDVIKAMDGISVANRIKRYCPLVPGSNNGGKLRNVHQLIFNSKNKFAVLSGYHIGGKPFNLKVPLVERNFIKDYARFFDMESTITSKMMTKDVGYVVYGNITEKNIDSIMVPLMQSKAIIFDLRKDIRAFNCLYMVSNYLLGKPAIYARDTHPDFHLPGMFTYEVANAGTPYARVGRNNPNPYRGKVILLVNECTQSVLEWAAMILKTAPNVTVIGSPTAGADGNVTRTILPGGYNINLSGLGIYYPNGGQTQRKGIHIDIAAPWTIKDFIDNTDPALNAALRFARGKEKE